MRIPVILYAAAVAFLFNLQEEKVSAQIVTPSVYGGVPISYGYADNDDDFGVLLALLLLAAKNRGGNNCCCNCNNVRTVPVPFPIPFPTNNPIIRQRDDEQTSDGNATIPPQVINFDVENDDESINDIKVKNAPRNIAKSASSSSASSASDSNAGTNSENSR